MQELLNADDCPSYKRLNVGLFLVVPYQLHKCRGNCIAQRLSLLKVSQASPAASCQQGPKAALPHVTCWYVLQRSSQSKLKELDLLQPDLRDHL